MRGFTAHCLGISARVLTPVTLNEHKGSALRGALYHALRGRFCALREVDECVTCPLWQACPVCTLVSTLAPDNRVGPDAARPTTEKPRTHGVRGLSGSAGPAQRSAATASQFTSLSRKFDR